MVHRGLTDPSGRASDALEIDAVAQVCPGGAATLKSIHIDIGWTFSSVPPTGSYELQLGGQTFTGVLSTGQIRINNQLCSVSGSGYLRICVTDGPIFRADVALDMPAIRTPRGLTRRLTNLGFYAGTDGVFDGRALWAVRAFKRVKMNNFTRNQSETENDLATQAFLEAVANAYGRFPDDLITGPAALAPVCLDFIPCDMFGPGVYRRGSFQTANAPDDVDPRDAGNAGVWEGARAVGVEVPIAGTFTVFLRAFDPSAGESPVTNRVNLPQPIHMAQLVLFELGYWLVRGAGGWTTLDGTDTRNSFTPDGHFGRYTQWAVREFQCHAKLANAAQEDVSSTELRYLPRLFADSPHALVGAARYPQNGPVSGALNEATRNALQAWADGALRCPVIVYASTDNRSAVANGSDMRRLVKENLWLYNDHIDIAPRMYAIDYSGYYTIPAAHGGFVTSGAHRFPRPIVLGQYTTDRHGGELSQPRWHHTWNSEYAEVRPDTMIGAGGADGVGLTAAQLSTFKVVRTASHFECYGYVDSLNAYDDVTISFGPCHWTLARCQRVAADDSPDERREMPAFFAFMRQNYAAAYGTYFEVFGLRPERAWNMLRMAGRTGNYGDRMMVQTEGGDVMLCGATGTDQYRYEENTYCKNWHVFYRFQMACRCSADVRRSMWDFARVRIRDILNKEFTIGGIVRRVGDYVTSEKGVAMLLRWHIFRPAHLFRPATRDNPNYLHDVLAAAIGAYPRASQSREDEVLRQLRDVGGPRTDGGLATIYGWTNVPQRGLVGYYHLNLRSPTLSGALNSFHFAPP